MIVSSILCVIIYISMRTECVHINHVTAPLFVEPGQPLLLVCDYDYQPEEESQLDLKWYFNDSPIPVFQWVPSMGKQPQVVSPLFRGMVDTGYEANNNSFKKHQALHIPHPDHRLSGSYMCKVSSFLDEDFQQSQVMVITYHKKSNSHIYLHEKIRTWSKLNVWWMELFLNLTSTYL